MEYSQKPTTIKSWAEEDRPREKLLLKGKQNLTDAELIAILLGMGTKQYSAVDLGKMILAVAQNDLNKLARLSINELMKIKGIGEAKAITIVAALELARRKKDTEAAKLPTLKTSKSTWEHLKPYLLDLDHEQFWIILLKRNLEVIKTIQVSAGGISGTVADPKIIFRHAVENLANGIILAHNHPSGNIQPSTADINLTRQLKIVAQALEITLMDHIIFADQRFYSFADNEMM
jgi:DNA repair protein RadC